jgi:hypothetical protein
MMRGLRALLVGRLFLSLLIAGDAMARLAGHV